jgi:hypothetical protein
MRTSVLCLLLAACGTSTAGMSGPTISGRIDDRSEQAPAIQSNDILRRERVAPKAQVQHVLIGWRELAKNYELHPRAQARSREEADALAVATLARARAGEDMAGLMNELSEDRGSSMNGNPYEVTADAKLVFEFKRLSLRLNVGEIGLVQSIYGWHIVKRVE